MNHTIGIVCLAISGGCGGFLAVLLRHRPTEALPGKSEWKGEFAAVGAELDDRRTERDQDRAERGRLFAAQQETMTAAPEGGVG